jgi:site-specific recombinase XerD
VSEKHNKSQTVDISPFLQSLKRQKVSGSTLRGYSTDLRSFFDHLRLSPESLDVSALERIQPQDIESYLRNLAQKSLRFSTIKRNVAAIRRFFSFLVEQEIITENPAKNLTVRPVANNALTSDQVVSLFQYLAQQQQKGNESDVIRYRRDEVILMMMIFYGIRQYQLGSLKLSQLQKNGKDVSLTVNRGFIIKLDGIVLQKLRDYLSIRKSNADTIFLEPLRKKPVDHSIMRTVLTELSYALRVECSPRTLYDTHLHLQQNPEERQRLLERIGSESSKRTYGAVSNA